MSFLPITACLLLLPIINAQYKSGDVRLVGGSYQWEGRVEIYLSRVWGTITDSDWTSYDAEAVCRKLGYFKPGATEHVGGYFGAGSGPIHLDYILCSGTEYNLTDCEIGNNTRQSDHSEDVGVKCQTIDSSYQEGDIRLVGGAYSWEGRVEIFWSGTWSAIRDTSWTNSDTAVVCRQLGHSTDGYVSRCCGVYGVGSGPVRIQSVSCSGSEATITSCSYSTSITYDHQYDVGVQCQKGGDYREGDIRLVGGVYSWVGRVEIFLNGEWGTISDDGSDRLDAHVVCRQLGYDTRYGLYTDTSRCCAIYGHGIGPIHMNNLGCSGTEFRLVNCSYETVTYSHTEDWGVTCNNDGPDSGEVRLYYSYNNPSFNRGRVEVYISDEWGTVTGSWTQDNADVVRLQLGYEIPREEISFPASYSSYVETVPIHISNVQCSGTESRLTECPHNLGGSGTVASQDCYYYDYRSFYRCSVGELRLVGGDTDMEGRVEMCTSYYNTWGTVCNKQWSPSHTKVVCRQLGYSDTEGSYEASHTFGEGTYPIVMDFVNCTGSETRLSYCHRFTHSYGCDHSADAGVHCQPVQCDDGDVRLLQGETMGQVEVCVNKRWATVCNDRWYDTAASTVCRQLGYYTGFTYNLNTWRTSRSLNVIGVSCTGTESRLKDCYYSTIEYYNGCYEDAGATCTLADCIDGELRLSEGDTQWDGRLEVCFSGRWGTVGSEGWSQVNIEISCNDLGYQYEPTTDPYSPRPATNSMLVYMSNVQCSGDELTLLDCSYSRNVSQPDHSNDIGIQCRKSSCDDGDLGLVGGKSKYEGLLEVCFSQRWGTVNGDGWSSSDTQVVCRQLGFDNVGDQSSYYKQGGILSAPIHMDNVACYGSEDKLIDCTYHSDTGEDTHQDDIWISCNKITSTEQSKNVTADTSEQSTTSEPTIAIALAVSLIGLAISVVVIGFLIFRMVYKHKQRNASSTNDSVHYHAEDGEGEKEAYEKPVGKEEVTPNYQPLTRSTMDESSHIYGNVRVNNGQGGSLPQRYITGDEQVYYTCT